MLHIGYSKNKRARSEQGMRMVGCIETPSVERDFSFVVAGSLIESSRLGFWKTRRVTFASQAIDSLSSHCGSKPLAVLRDRTGHWATFLPTMQHREDFEASLSYTLTGIE